MASKLNRKSGIKLRKAHNLASERGKVKDSLNILLIEDSVVDAYMTKEAIGKHMPCSCNIKHVENILSAEAILSKDCNIDIVILDLGLPDTSSGRETFERIERIEVIKEKIPVVILTSETDHSTAIKFVDGGAEDYITKTTARDNPALLCDAVDFALTRHRKLAHLKEESYNKLREKDMILGWLSGDYSITK